MKDWLKRLQFKGRSAKTVIEYLPDADEIERSPVPPMAQLTMHVLLLGLVSFIIWAALSELDEVVVAQGRLVNPSPNVVVQPLETGVIKTLDVRVGQVVKKGEVLATLDSTFAKADETQLQVRLDSLETQLQGLSQELSGEVAVEGTTNSADSKLQSQLLSERKANYQAQQSKMAETAAKLRANLATNRSDQQLISSRLRSLKEIEAMQEKMVAQKYGAPLQLLEAQARSKEVERDLQLAKNRELEIMREMSAFSSEKTAFEKGWRQKLMEETLAVSRERDAIKEQLLKADRRSRLVTLTAPVDGVVLEIAKLSPGSIVREAETFFTLVPLNAPLEAEVHIDSLDVGYVKLGLPSHIKVDAFPFQRHGTLDGTVRTVSEDAFRREISSKTGSDAYYIGRVALNGEALKNMTDGARLLPGMTLAAEIVVGQRSVLSYMAWPLTKGISEAAREP